MRGVASGVCGAAALDDFDIEDGGGGDEEDERRENEEVQRGA